METSDYDQRLSVYCSRGTVNAYRFESVRSDLENHVNHSLTILGVCADVRAEIQEQLEKIKSFGCGYRYDLPSVDIGDENRVVVYVNLFNEMLEGYISKTCGELKCFIEYFDVEEDEKDGLDIVSWRRTA